MLLKCNYCGHAWSGEPDAEGMLHCPACTKKLSLSIAQRLGAGSAPTQPAPPKATPQPAATPSQSAAATPSQSPSGTMIKPAALPKQAPAAGGSSSPGGASHFTGGASHSGDSDSGSTMVGSKLPPSSNPPLAKIPAGSVPAGAQVNPASGKPAAGHPAAPGGASQRVELDTAQAAKPKPKKSRAHKMEHLIGKTVDGYRIEKLLGAGGMGAVFLAHQLSLDRKVAFKVLPSLFANNADFLARFTREALSAAQLTHHNLIQVHDVGSTDEVHYIAMEFVPGQSLGDMIKKDGRLQPDAAAGYILQTARGLKFAHERGIVHRDIKPDNIMLNDQGIVKIADMGLAKMRGEAEPDMKALPSPETVPTPPPAPRGRGATEKIASDTNLTQASVAMGTPAYMAPEQARDAGSVDARADQYSLGCTLYYLIAGVTPYQGATAHELISKHQHDKFTPIDVHVKGVPPAMRVVIERMLEKEPASRYPSMGDVMKDLEAFLGIDSDKGPYTPREQHLAALDAALASYYAAGAIKLRKLATTGFFAIMAVCVIALLFMGSFAWAGGLLGLLVLTPAADFIIEGMRTRNDLFRRVRSVFFGMPKMSWVKLVFGIALTFAVLAAIGWLAFWIGFGVLAVLLAMAYQTIVVRRLKRERADAVEKTAGMLRELRLRGLSEDALQDFISRFSGEHWEEFFEEFFGYEAMLIARGKWAAADKVKKRRKHATWREPIARWLESVEESRKSARERKQLAKVEKARLKASGATEAEATKQADASATMIMDQSLKKMRKEAKAAKTAEAGGVEFGATKTARRSGIGFWFAVLRGVLGLAGLGAYAVLGLKISIPIIGGLIAPLGEMGFAGHAYGAIVSAALIVSVFSSRFFAALLVLVGAGTVFFAGKLAGQPLIGMFPQGLIGLAGAALALLGVAGPLVARLLGWKF